VLLRQFWLSLFVSKVLKQLYENPKANSGPSSSKTKFISKMTFLSHDGARSERKGKFGKSLNNTLLLFMNLGSITMEQAKIKAEASITNIS